jgi:hypothetical protein
MLDDRVERLLRKAEEATDRNDIDQAEMYRTLAGHAAYLNRKEARDINRTFLGITRTGDDT